MKYPILTLALASLTAAASAQLAPTASRRADVGSVGVTYNHVNGWDLGSQGENSVTVDGRVHLTRQFFLTASYTDNQDISFGPITLTPSSWSLGLGGKFDAGSGSIEAAYAFRRVDFGVPLPGADDSINQNLLKLGYTHDLGSGFSAGVSVLGILNETDFDNVFAPVFTVAYRFNFGLSLDVNYSTKNTVLGLDESGVDFGSTLSIGARYNF